MTDTVKYIEISLPKDMSAAFSRIVRINHLFLDNDCLPTQIEKLQ